MVEDKRFTLGDYSNGIREIWINEDEEYFDVDCEHSEMVVDLLNNLSEENEELKSFKKKVFELLDDNIEMYENTVTNDEYLQVQLDVKLKTLYNLRKELLK